MHSTDKADLQNGLIKKVPECVVSDSPLGVVCVLDGGSISAYPGLSPSHLSISVISSLFIVILKTCLWYLMATAATLLPRIRLTSGG